MLRKNLNVGKLMSKNLRTCLKDTTLREVAHMMSEFNCGAIPIVDSKETMKPIGIITDRDIVSRTLGKDVNPFERSVGDFMTNQCFTVPEMASLSTALKTMQENKIRRVVVVNDQQKCVGIISQADLALHSSDGRIAKFLRQVSKPFKFHEKRAA